ncbi:hypothetical protein RO21_11820 [[Actinobacillus] muris]|uniref:DUF4224 domain-containing protein n=1 Tax=Muribacter muris TaxID=67855 RepID=A0A0J5P431_9PAST|nr:DUF4224 domain-containing protein [Muribacter muris]KMK50435.1 hypothetical protein RO21_11820 [[Actinobacillus] muris] [Muribacter muris]
MEFLTDEELEIYTGYERPADQVGWLKDKNYVPFTINAKGKPVVIFKHVFGFRRDGLDNTISSQEVAWNPSPPPKPSSQRN